MSMSPDLAGPAHEAATAGSATPITEPGSTTSASSRVGIVRGNEGDLAVLVANPETMEVVPGIERLVLHPFHRIRTLDNTRWPAAPTLEPAGDASEQGVVLLGALGRWIESMNMTGAFRDEHERERDVLSDADAVDDRSARNLLRQHWPFVSQAVTIEPEGRLTFGRCNRRHRIVLLVNCTMSGTRRLVNVMH
jgi:hypothetical protein